MEGAGGVLVPLSDKVLMADLMKALGAEVILVSENYLGSINHTLLSVEALRSRNIPIKGIIFNSAGNSSSEDYILRHSGLPCLLCKPEEPKITKEVILKYSKMIDWK
jgi:dethiobiotin synthetase